MARTDKIERIRVLQSKIHQLAEWRLVDIDRKRDELTETEARLVATLNGDAPLHGLFVEAMARRLAALAREGDRLARAREAQQRRLQEEGLRLKRFERASLRAQREQMTELRKQSFAILLDALAAVDDASLP